MEIISVIKLKMFLW